MPVVAPVSQENPTAALKAQLAHNVPTAGADVVMSPSGSSSGSDSAPLADIDEWQDYKVEEDPTFNPINPNKTREQFRNYADNARKERVTNFYKLQHTQQSFAFVEEMETRYNKLNHFKMGVWEALEYLDKIVDDSDPDTNLTQIEHALQTAEACRSKLPGAEYDWFHLTGLIHDLGKILAVKDDSLGLPGEPQWAVVGDTFPVGLPFSKNCVFSEFFEANPDFNNSKFNQGLGIYQPGCGLFNVHMSYGHDEYLYQVCVGNGSTLPLPALYMIRYHSFYPWHNKGDYQGILNDTDKEMLQWVLKFNECDLYSKAAERPDLKTLMPYYKGLIAKYFPTTLRW